MSKNFKWPGTIEKIKNFQRNHGLKVDGLFGRLSKAKLWRTRGHRNGYTHLINYPLRVGGATSSKAYLEAKERHLDNSGHEVELSKKGVVILWGILTSGWKTGFNYLSTQDGITFGGRRLAAGTLLRFVRDNEELFHPYFHEKDWRRIFNKTSVPRQKRKRADKPAIPDVNNGFPLDEVRMRESFMFAAADKRIWDAQILEGNDFINEILNEYPNYKDARLITLLCRAANSGRYKYTTKISPKLSEKRAYRKLKKLYSDTKNHRRRIKVIEREIPKGTTWR